MILYPKAGYSYSGLTVVLNRASRFDVQAGSLVTGNAGNYFNECLLAGGNARVHRSTISIRTLDEPEALLPGTRTLLLMGEESVRRYLGQSTSLLEQRGSPFKYGDITCVATFAPQDANDRTNYFSADADEDDDETGAHENEEAKSTHGRTRRKNWRFWMRSDIKKIARLTSQQLALPTPRYHFYPDVEEVIHLLTTTKDTDFYFDTETASNFQMTCFGFSLDAGANIYVVPMLQTHIKPLAYFYDRTDRLLRALSVALCNNRVVAHNSPFDLFVCVWRYGLPIGARVFDTMLAHNRCFIEVEKSLGHVISLYTDLPYHKNEGIFEPHTQAQVQQLYEYNGKDVFALTQVKPALEEQAARLGATESVAQVNRMVVPYLTMSLQGIRLNIPRIEKVVDYHQRYNDQIQRLLDRLAWPGFNPNSWQQVSKYLYEDASYKKDGRRYKIKKPAVDATNEKTLLALLLDNDIPIIPCVLKFRGNRKRISKVRIKSSKEFAPRYYFGIHSRERKDYPRITTSWRLAKTVTMRLGSSKLFSFGDNLQNWEKELRKVIAPDEGKCFLQADQSGAEALIVAYLCRPGNFRDVFIHSINPHCLIAMRCFEEQLSAEIGFSLKPYNQLPVRALASEAKWPEIQRCIKASDDWPPERRYYYMGKKANHSLNYDAKAGVLRMALLKDSEGAVDLSFEQANRIISTRMGLFPEIQEWQRSVVQEAWRTKLLRNLFGHPRTITTFIDESQYKELYAFAPQSTVGQITNYAITELQEKILAGDKVLVDGGVDVLQNNHDSVLLQCWNNAETRKSVGAALQQHLNRALVAPRGEKFNMRSDLQWSEKSWGEMETLKI